MGRKYICFFLDVNTRGREAMPKKRTYASGQYFWKREARTVNKCENICVLSGIYEVCKSIQFSQKLSWTKTINLLKYLMMTWEIFSEIYYVGCSNFWDLFEETDHFETQKINRKFSEETLQIIYTRIQE